MAKISVSLLDADWSNLLKSLKKLTDAKFDNFHMDVMDGNFVNNITYGSKFCKVIKELVPNAFVEAHLMVNDPIKHFAQFRNIGMDCIIVHFEALYYREINNLLLDIQAAQILSGITLKPNTNVEQIYEYLKNTNVVMVMSVEPGKGGQEFMSEALTKIAKLVNYRKLKNLKYEILVDGGINPKTCKLAKEAGADRFVVGSYIYKNGEKQSYNEFIKI